MNVIVSNKQKGIIDNANIDAIKDLNGLFSVDDLVNKFKNYFFSKMILDATSVVNFATRDVLQKLSDEIGPDRLIILLPSTPEPPEEFKKLLIELKIFNFSNNIDDIVKFIEKPNTYENVMGTIKNSFTNTSKNFYVDNSIKDEDAEFDNDTDSNSEEHSSLGDVMSSFSINDDVVSNVASDNQNDFDKVIEPDKPVVDDLTSNELMSNTEIDNSSSNSHIFLDASGFDNTQDYYKPKEKKVIGFKNITEHAGSTTLIYLIEKEAQKRNLDVVSVEVNRDDFKLFRNNKMFSVQGNNLSNALGSLNESVILVDLNDLQDDSLCSEVVYLVEPSVIKLNKLMMINRDIFNTLKNKRVILNKSMLSNNDVSVLEKEANMPFFFNISPVNDRSDNSIISELFDKLVNR